MKEEHICEMKIPQSVYKIGMFSQMNKVTVKALRHYDEIGILKPAFVESESGYRYYTSDQLPALQRIMALRSMGFTLDEIKHVMEGASEEALLKKKRAELLKQLANDTLKLSQVESYLAGDGVDYDYPVRIKEVPEVIAATMRMVIENYDGLFHVMPAMGSEMERLGCVCAIPEYCFTIYHDGEYKDENIDVEICEAVTEKKEDSDKVKFKVIPAIKEAACVMHKGSYDDFPRAYSAVIRWVEENGYEIIGNPRESYIDGVWNKDSVDEWLTEIQFPVQRK